MAHNTFVYFEMPAPCDDGEVAPVTSLPHAARVSRWYQGYDMGDLLLEYIATCHSRILVTLRWLGVGEVDLVRLSKWRLNVT